MIGYCQHAKDRILVYEYMPNGSLHDCLHGRKNFLQSIKSSWAFPLYVHHDVTTILLLFTTFCRLNTLKQSFFFGSLVQDHQQFQIHSTGWLASILPMMLQKVPKKRIGLNFCHWMEKASNFFTSQFQVEENLIKKKVFNEYDNWVGLVTIHIPRTSMASRKHLNLRTGLIWEITKSWLHTTLCSVVDLELKLPDFQQWFNFVHVG